MAKTKALYLHPALTKAIDILELLEAEQRALSLSTIHRRIKASKTTVYRLLQTYVQRGYLSLDQEGHYRIAKRPKKLRFGFAGESSDMPFSVAVTESIKAAAASYGIELLVLDNRYDAATAVANAERFVSEQVDLVIDFQIEQSVAGVISHKISGANIPLIAVDIPHPHATYFGADNYRIGFAAGEVLAKHALKYWKGKVNWVLALELQQAGPFVQNRATGAFDGILSLLPKLDPAMFLRVDSGGLESKTVKLVQNFFRQHPHAKGVLIPAHNDTVALAALQAVRDLKKEKAVAIVGHDGLPGAIAEVGDPGSALVGSIKNSMESYGPRLIPLALSILRGEVVAPYNFTEFQAVTRQSLRASD